MSLQWFAGYLGFQWRVEIVTSTTVDAELEVQLQAELSVTAVIDAALSAPKTAKPVIVLNM